MDRKDMRIIELLEENAQRTHAAVARHLGVSEETARRRTARLIDANVLRVVAVPNDELLGYVTKAIIGINVEPSLVDSVAGLLAKGNIAQWVVITTGQFDIMVQIVATNLEELYDVIRREIGSIVGVTGVQTMIGLATPKLPYVGNRNGTH